MDITYSTLAFADAIHDFGRLAIYHKADIQYGLPGHVLNIDDLIGIHVLEDKLLDIFSARNNDIHELQLTTANKVHKILCGGEYTTFGLVGDANGANHIIDILEKGKKPYYIVRNRENMCDSAYTPSLSHVRTGIVVTDNNGETISYSAWSEDVTVSSKFCSKYNYCLLYDMSDKIKYIVDHDEFDITNSFSNPNNRGNIVNIVNASGDSDKISMAFQRKRSGDWFQAISTFDTQRNYIMSNGASQKLTGPVYFCTEDRAAAAYSIAIGANTIFVQRGTQLHFIYRNKIELDIDIFSDTMTFNTSDVNKYKEIITSAMNVYEMRTAMILNELSTKTPSTRTEILQYIGYIYSYVLCKTRFGKYLELSTDALNKFMLDLPITDSEKRRIIDLYRNASFNIPALLSHNIHEPSAFPSLSTLSPISITGEPGYSEIYISSLLSNFKRVNEMVPYIHLIVNRILEFSTQSDNMLLHYSVLLVHNEHSGGFSKEPNSNSRVNVLINTYIAYLKQMHGGVRLNEIKQGPAGLYVSEDFSYIYGNLKHIVQSTGIMKEELHAFEEYKRLKELQIQEEERTPLNPELDAKILRILQSKEKN